MLCSVAPARLSKVVFLFRLWAKPTQALENCEAKAEKEREYNVFEVLCWRGNKNAASPPMKGAGPQRVGRLPGELGSVTALH